jgi:hypothetical protein
MKTWQVVVDGKMVVMTVPQLLKRIQRPQHSSGLMQDKQQLSLSQQALTRREQQQELQLLVKEPSMLTQQLTTTTPRQCQQV